MSKDLKFAWCCEDLQKMFLGLINHEGIKFCPFCGGKVNQECGNYMVSMAQAAAKGPGR